MEQLLDRTVDRIKKIMEEQNIRPNTWVLDGIRLELNAALMSACLIGRTEALQEVIRRLKEWNRTP